MKHFLSIMTLLLALGLFTGCTRVDDETLRAAHSAVERGAVVVDVRTVKEYNSKHVRGALNIPVEEISKTVARVPRGKELVIYCASGNRSAHATAILRQKGWTVFDVATQGDFERKLPPVKMKQ